MFEHVEHVCFVRTTFERSHKRWKEKNFLLSAGLYAWGAEAGGVGMLETSRDCIILHYLNQSFAQSPVSQCSTCFWGAGLQPDPVCSLGLISCLDHSNWLKSGTLQTKCHVCHKERYHKRKKTQNSGASFSFFVEIKAISTNTLTMFHANTAECASY